jgi:hypothetical protein
MISEDTCPLGGDCEATGWVPDPSFCGDPEHCDPYVVCKCNPGYLQDDEYEKWIAEWRKEEASIEERYPGKTLLTLTEEEYAEVKAEWWNWLREEMGEIMKRRREQI